MARQHDPLAMKLSSADDRVLLSKWLPPRAGVVPKIRVGNRWVNVLWALPLIFLGLVVGVTVAQALRELPAIQSFLLRYPGVPTSSVVVTSGFPAWLRLMHFLNVFFMTFIVRAGVQILADHLATLLEARLHAGNRVVSFSERSSYRPHMDREGRFRHPARMAGDPGYPSLHRARAMVAFFDHPILDDQRYCVLRTVGST